MEQLVNLSIDKAENLLSTAKNELCRPAEDVVPYSICQNAYYSIINYLGSFLRDNGIDIKESSDLEYLHNSCKTIDDKFNELQLSPLYHPKKSKDVWMNLNTANAFLSLAEKTRKMVQSI